MAERTIDAGGLSKESIELLLAAIAGQGRNHGIITCLEYMSGAHYGAGDTEKLHPPTEKRRFADYKSGLGKLVERGLVEQRSKVMYELTSDGYLAADEFAARAAALPQQ